MWKKVLAIIGVLAGILGASLLGRRNTNRGRVPGVDDNLREARESAGRTRDSIESAKRELGESRARAGEIAIRNNDARADVKRAKELLRQAKARSGNVGRSRGLG